MANRIEEAFNDCFERLTLGESLDSCLRSYPEYAVELDIMLRTAYDVKRRAYPIQPRPAFKYWSRVKLQGAQDYVAKQPAPQKSSPFNYRRSLAISLAGLLVFVIASSGTAAASYEALPDQPLYGVKMVVEQAQLTLAVSDVDKAELYASLAGKRAHEIEAMAQQGKADYLSGPTARMDYQLEQAEIYIGKYQTANAAIAAAATGALPAAASTANVPTQPTETSTADVPAQPVQTVPAPVTEEKPDVITPEGKSGTARTAIKGPLPPLRGAVNVNKAKTALNSSTAKSLAALQDALPKAPESARPAIIKSIERIKKANEWSQRNLNEDPEDQGQDDEQRTIQPRPNTLPVKPLPDGVKPRLDEDGHIITPDRPQYIPPLNNNLPRKDLLPLNKPVSTDTVVPGEMNNQTVNPHVEIEEKDTPDNEQNMRIQVPVTPLVPRTTIGGDSPFIK
jgi:hypothetical protein